MKTVFWRVRYLKKPFNYADLGKFFLSLFLFFNLMSPAVGQNNTEIFDLDSGEKLSLPAGNWKLKAKNEFHPNTVTTVNLFLLENQVESSPVRFALIQKGITPRGWRYGEGSVYDVGNIAFMKEMYGTSETQIVTRISNLYPLTEKSIKIADGFPLLKRMQELGVDLTKLPKINEDKYIISDLRVIQPKTYIRLSMVMRLPGSDTSSGLQSNFFSNFNNPVIDSLKDWNKANINALESSFF